MLTKVHHVTYVVRDVQQMAHYLEGTFGMKPERTDEFSDRGYKTLSIETSSSRGIYFQLADGEVS